MDIRSIFRNCDGGVITKGGRGRIGESPDGSGDLPALAGPDRQIHRVLTVKPVTRPQGHKVAEFKPPGKSSKESPPHPYRKPTQVDEENIHRRSREHSFRNSAT